MKTSDQFPIPLECPQCHKKFQKRLSELKANAEFPCPGCKATFTVSGNEFEAMRKSLDDLDKKLAGLSRSIKLKL